MLCVCLCSFTVVFVADDGGGRARATMASRLELLLALSGASLGSALKLWNSGV